MLWSLPVRLGRKKGRGRGRFKDWVSRSSDSQEDHNNQLHDAPCRRCQLPKLAYKISVSGSLIRIKALQANALSRFQSNSVCFKLAVIFGETANDCQLEKVIEVLSIRDEGGSTLPATFGKKFWIDERSWRQAGRADVVDLIL
jgi:hypothetical protein